MFINTCFIIDVITLFILTKLVSSTAWSSADLSILGVIHGDSSTVPLWWWWTVVFHRSRSLVHQVLGVSSLLFTLIDSVWPCWFILLNFPMVRHSSFVLHHGIPWLHFMPIQSFMAPIREDSSRFAVLIAPWSGFRLSQTRLCRYGRYTNQVQMQDGIDSGGCVQNGVLACQSFGRELIYWEPSTECALPVKWRAMSRG